MRQIEQLNLGMGEEDERDLSPEKLREKRDHVAIMKKSWKLLPKILSGEKTIESRWYSLRAAPWGKVYPEDTIYFKDSGDPITVRATVDRVDAFDNLTPELVRELLEEYGDEDGLSKESLPEFFELFKNKKYCLLMHLRDAQNVEPFDIDKRGFGAGSAWLCVDNIKQIKK